jgi:5-methylcytosine-specific restriction endonuclease McrA
MSKAEKKALKFRRTFPECPLCLRQSTGLRINKFCRCICKPEDFIDTEMIINGQIVKQQMVKKENVLSLKLMYELRVADAQKFLPVAKKKKESDKSKSKKVARAKKQKFYDSWEWKALRFRALKDYGSKCQLCGATSKTDKICVDHIKPISLFWELRLDFENLQVLCDNCNKGKSNTDFTDFRETNE